VNPEACRQLGVRSIVVVPLFADDRVVGVFEIFSPLADGFRERDLKTLQELASRVTEATHASTKKPVVPRQDATPVPSGGDTATESASESPTPVTSAGQAYRALLFGSNTTRILRATVLVLATVLCLMLGFRWGWQRAHGAKAARATPAAPTPVTTPQNTAIPGDSTQDITIGNLKNTSPKPSAGNRGKATTQSDTGSLAVYQDGNLVYQQKPVATRAQSQTGNSSEQLNEQSPAPPPQTATESANTNPPPKPPEPEMTASIPRTSLTAMNPGIVLPGANLAAPIPAIRVSQGITGGKLVRRVEPQYPYQAKQQRVGGDVMLQAVIGKDGRVHDIKTIRGNEMLAAAAMNAVRQWRYEPYKLNGDPVEMQTEITIKFALP
jgi:TonB family protein